MEFASELLIKALKGKAKMVEIDSGLRRGPEDREAHLRTWRDGMRHLLFILSERPQLFEFIGLGLMLLASALQIAAYALGPTQILGLNVFDLHSKILLLLGGVAGAQLYLFSCIMYLRGKHRSLGITKKLITLDEGVLFFWLLMTFAVQAIVVSFIFYAWVRAGFGGLDLTDVLMVCGHVLSVAGILAIGLLGIHVFKKSERGM
jgi:hypothetical protein